ncbi:large colossin-like cell wall protein with CnaB repeat domains [Psychroflexus torquis ATCC 700755]|uniref:Large colossin-like cell wall protein with CnaB repeat domains n=1 Tax=Psychroflexus torquis (strain ATCC 700755 / CIP 106069 / ACAM 623) TaxID=313595 RepID=K4IB75_PSYTT|nr:SdrD B-like domain-containing protein [Psychroflexus torquis]AFU67679.1 large colossin-like cell wall protein with CnaB repeat domains [Psychroflexus torquis ATCC 700755]
MRIITPTYLFLFIFLFINIGAFAQEEKSYTSNPFLPNPFESLLARFADPGTVTGKVYYDINNNGFQDAGEPGLEGVIIQFRRFPSGGSLDNVETDVNGNWSQNIQPGDIIYFIQPFGEDTADYADNLVITEGFGGGRATIDSNTTTDTGPTGYAFFKNVIGHLYFDENGNGTQDASEADMPDVDVVIEDFLGDFVTVITDANGDWAAIINIGEFDVDIDNSDPDFPTGATQTEGTDLTTYQLSIDINNLPDNLLAPLFTENDGFFLSGELSGLLYDDLNNNGSQDPGEPGFENVNIIITTSLGDTITVPTDANGEWNSTVPVGLTTTEVDTSDPDFPSGVAQTEGTNPTTTTVILNQSFNEIDGFFKVGQLIGNLYFDLNGNGTQDAAEPDMPNVDVDIVDGIGQTFVETTDADGEWSATVSTGTATATIDQNDPDFPTGATQTEGTDPTIYPVASGEIYSENSGFFQSGEVSGLLYDDLNNNGSQDPGEPGFINFNIDITNSLGETITVQTDANGEWSSIVPVGSTIIDVDNDPDFPNASQTEGTNPTTTTVIINQSFNEIDGFFKIATLSGHLYFDVNGNGIQDPTEPDMPDVDVEIVDGIGQTSIETTDVNGDWTINVSAGTATTTINQNDPQFPTGAEQTEGENPTVIQNVEIGETYSEIDGFYETGTLTGHLYFDENGNGAQEPSEEDMPNVDVEITDIFGVITELATDANGDWSLVLPQGDATSSIDQSDPDFPTGAAQTEGTDPTTTTVVTGQTVNEIDGFYETGTLTGHLYFDENGNGTQEPSEADMPNVDVEITDVFGVVTTLITNANGDWSIVLPQGIATSSIVRSDPDFPSGTAQTEGTDPTTTTIVSGETFNEIDGFFGTGTLTGHLYFDENGNGTQELSEADMPNVDVEITDIFGVITILVTDANGDWSKNLPLGNATSSIDQSDPDFPTGAAQTEGDDPTITVILTGQTVNEIDGFFETGILMGHLYFDENGNGTQELSEADMPNVEVEITDVFGAVTTLVTDADGDWSLVLPQGDAISRIIRSDPDFPIGVTQTEGTDPTITTILGGQSLSEVDGFFVSGELTGHLYFDENGNGTQEPSEADMPNVDVEITDVFGDTTTLVTDANGDWSIGLSPGNATSNIDETDPDFPTGAAQTEGTDPTTTAIVNGQTFNEIDGFYESGTLTGHLYFDENGNGTQEPSEADMPNVDVEITDVFGVVTTLVTDAIGDWSIELSPGNAISNIDETDPDFPTGAAQTEGDNPTATTIVTGQTVNEIDGFYETGTLTGHLYFDENGNGTQEPSEADMPNVDVEITDVFGSVTTLVTDANGDWSLVLPQGDAISSIVRSDPDFPAGAAQTEGDDPTTTTIVTGQTFNEIDGFYEIGTLTGHLYFDENGNGTQEPSEADMPNVDVEITDVFGAVTTLTTNANGDWSLVLPQGDATSSIVRSDPDFPTGAAQTEGDDPTTTAIVNGQTVNEIDGFFETGILTGHLYFDENGNGTQELSEADMPNVDVEITDSFSQVQTVTTDANGDWSIGLSPGNATSNIDQADPDFPTGSTQTEGEDPTTTAIVTGQTFNEIDGFYESGTLTGHLYFDENGNGTQEPIEADMPNVEVEITDVFGAFTTLVSDANGDWSLVLPVGDATSSIVRSDPDFPSGAAQTEGTDPTTTTIITGQTFNEIDGFFETGILTGHLYFDENGNGTQEPSEADMPNVDVEITDSFSQVQTVTTDANGDWSIGLSPGNATSNIDENDPDFPTGATQTEGTDPTTTTIVTGQTFNEIDGFYESGTLTGHLYFDENGNGTQEPSEVDMPNVDVEITDVFGAVTTLVTDVNGDWTIELSPGNATSSIVRSDPDFPSGATQTEGTDPTTTAIVNGQTFNEIDGFYETGILTGHLYFDENGNGTQELSEADMPNVDVEITDSFSQVQTVTTDANGDWSIGLSPGNATSNIDENDPDFPTGATQTEGTDPTTTTIVTGQTFNEIDGFYESGTLTGHLYFDENGNGTQEASEADMPNVDVEITDVFGAVTTLVTNANGDWSLVLPQGDAISSIVRSDPDFPTGAAQTEGTDPTTTTILTGQTFNEIDGFFETGTLTGHLYFDENGNGTQEPSEADMPNVDVEITDVFGAVTTLVTNANGDWSIVLPQGNATSNIDETDPDFPTGAAQTEGTDPTTTTVVTGQTFNEIDGFYETGTLTGHLYFDINGNGTQEPTEPDMPNVDVEITDVFGAVTTLVSDADGDWSLVLPQGDATSSIVRSDPDFPTGAAQTEGTDPTTTTVVTGQTFNEIDGFFETGILIGHLYFDENGNGTQEPSEIDMPNVDVEITDSFSQVQTVTTDANGDWSLVLPQGDAISSIVRSDPDFPTGATQTEGTDPTTTAIVTGQTFNEIDGFYESGTLTGHLYFDENGNGTQEPSEADMPDVDVEITDVFGAVTTLVTDANGDWSLVLPQGDAISSIVRSDPDFPTGAAQTEGTDPTTTAIINGQTFNEIDGFFETGTLTGHLYFDENGNGTQEPSEADMPNVDVEITDSFSQVQTVTTNANGDWSLVLPQGDATSSIVRSDPDFPTGAAQTEGTDPTTTTVVTGQTFNEIDGFYETGTLTGHLYFDENGNGTQELSEADMPNVDVEITDVFGVVTTLVSDANGDWSIVLPQGDATSNIDEADPDFPTGAAQTEGDDPTTTAIVTGQTFNEIDGFYESGTLTGHLYFDENGNGTQEPSEADMPNVEVEITDVFGAVTTLVTNANGDWSLVLPQGDATSSIVRSDPDFPTGAAQTEGTDPTTTAIVTGQTFNEIDGFFETGTLTGHLYFDENGNGTQEPSEADMPNVEVEITDVFGAVTTLVTNANGDWSLVLPQGDATSSIVRSDPDFPTGAAQTEGTDPTTTTVVTGQTVNEIDGFYETGSLAGHLYFDENGNGTQEPSESDMPNVDVEITDVFSLVQTVTTDANGDWSIVLPQGDATSSIVRSDPDFPTGAAQTEGTDPTTTTVVTGQTFNEIDGFFETGILTGHLYFDENGNGTQEPTEADMPNVDVEITDSFSQVQTVTTDANGDWSLVLPQGDAISSIVRSDPDFPTGATQTEGDDPTTTTIVTGQTFNEIDGFFESGTLTGHLYFDENGNGTQELSEADMPNVDVEITDSFSQVQTVTTDANGDWSLVLPQGDATSSIVRSDPDFPTGAAQTEGDDPTTTAIVTGQTFNEIDGFYESGTLTGHLYFDENGNGTQEPSEADMPDVDVEITDVFGVVTTLVTDADGDWSIVLPQGDATSSIVRSDPDFPTGAAQTEGTDPTTTTVVTGQTFNEIDGFYESGILIGHLYFDENGNGTQEPSEIDMPNVDVEITDSFSQVQTVTTDANGDWSLVLPQGDATSSIVRSDPDFPTGVTQTEGTDPTTTAIVTGQTFNEIDGFYESGTLTGHLYFDENGNGTQEASEADMPSVDVEITDSFSQVQTLTTDANGDWSLVLPQGDATSSIVRSDPDFPTGATQTEGDDPTTTTIVTGQTFNEIDGFYESGTLTGHLYFDENGNGTQEASEADMPNVDVEITDSFSQVQTVTTDANGDWSLVLPQGDAISSIVRSDPDFPTGAAQTEGDDPTTTTILTGQTFNEIDGFYESGTLTGHLYFDINGNGTQEPTEPDMPSVDVEITDVFGVVTTLITDANGDWSLVLPQGDATSNIDETDPDFPIGAAQTEGDDPTTTTIVNGQTFNEIDGFFESGTLTGHLYFDENGNGTQEPSEADMTDVDVEITDSFSQVQTVTTDANGDWSLVLPQGDATSSIVRSDPDFPTGATQTEGTDPTTTAIVTGQTFNEIDGFYESGTLTGHLYFDENGNGTQEPSEADMPDVDVEITDVFGALTTLVTDADGDWSIVLPQGDATSSIVRSDPDFPTGATQTEGDDPTTTTIVNGQTVNEIDGFFVSGELTGHLYFDENGNGTQEPSEIDMPNVDIEITDVFGATTTLVTDANGDWSIELSPGNATSSIVRSDPDFPTGATQTEGDDPTTTAIVTGQTFNEIDGFYESGTLTGHLYFDENGNGTQDPIEPDMPNVDVEITDVFSQVQTVTTDANGDWSIDLPLGDATSNIDETDLDFPAGALLTEGTDPTITTILGGQTFNEIDGFFELGKLTGHLYFDLNGNGTQDSSEADMPNVDVVITDVFGTTTTLVTDANGDWNIDLPPGNATSDIDETDADFPIGSSQTEGDDPTNTTIVIGQTFNEVDGFYELGILSGRLYFDNNGNGTQDTSEEGIPNVTLFVIDSFGDQLEVETNIDGDWDIEVIAGVTISEIDITDLDFPTDVTQTEGTNPTTTLVNAGSLVISDNDGFLIDDIIIYNAVSSEGSTFQNQFFRIEGIQNYPENSVQIFNRQGVKVFDVEGYGENNNKLFRGFSSGNITIQKDERLPTGTYFYILNYINRNGTPERKNGYLHLN